MKISDMIQLTKQVKALTSSIKAREGTIKDTIQKSNKVIKAMSQKKAGDK